ncbi:RNA polymerase sigma factor [Brevundimonas sp. SORGH_AS_0993]|uniref:RNA polymerase sigma factor n=1 Tax=Brevundimonas sp. SORGH_AS_0993 TaxID=3041794 RepID=UPI00278060D8|nr:sigma-70 family RNA polymerase sigma factor [Brevundimonas sp. SORGH_AS_0993]MDQ1153428.1 RNA polymerase sigma factor (sigma-70 family) [Brevundimonas sp. SORGH_AS_0993]
MLPQEGSSNPPSPLTDLHSRFRAPLHAFFLRRLNDPAAAEDLTQDAFVKLLAAAERDKVDDPGALLFTIAGGLLNDRYRMSRRRRDALLANVDTGPVSPVTLEFVETGDPERLVLARERIAAVTRALDELGERTRTIYVLFRLENMKQRDIAALFGVSKSTVEKEIVKAGLHLNKRLRALTR